MSNPTKIHTNKTPVRIHFIPEWAERRHLKQADIVRELDVEKGLVSKWFKGTLPKHEYLVRLADLFGTTVSGLFQDPYDDWLTQFFKDKTEQQKESAINLLKLFFEQNKITGTDGK